MNSRTNFFLTALACVALILASALPSVAQIPSPGAPQSSSVLITNATIHVGNGRVIEQGAIAFENGKLTVVTNGMTAPDPSGFGEVIDAEGGHMYPGFIAPNSTLGLTEIGSVRATHDFKDVGSLLPHVRSLIAYNTESRITPTVRTNGVLLAQATPRGNLISGTSSVVQLDAWNWEDAAVRVDDGIHLNWPKEYRQTGWWAEPGPVKKNDKRDVKMAELNQFFKEAHIYAGLSAPENTNLKYEAMRGLFDGTQSLYLHANYAKDIVSSVEFAHAHGVKNIVIVGGYDAWRVPGVLKDNKVSVILRRLHALPLRPEDPVDLPFQLPAKLHAAGIPFCLNNAGDMEAMGTRNLPFYAGTAQAYGLEAEDAVRSVTLSAAEILGISDRVGSLEEGKDATFFISRGDALDMRTNDLTHAFIQGRKVVLKDPQTFLYNKYKARYEAEK